MYSAVTVAQNEPREIHEALRLLTQHIHDDILDTLVSNFFFILLPRVVRESAKVRSRERFTLHNIQRVVLVVTANFHHFI